MIPRRRPARLLLQLALAVAAVVVLGAPAQAGPAQANDQERYVFEHTNELRRDEGVGVVWPKDELITRARSWARSLADRNTLEHSDLHTVEPGWTAVGENVGRSTSVEDVFRRLVASPEHHHAMVNGSYVRVGVGTARAGDGNLYVVQVFWRGCGPDGEAACAR
jgi:uncharacterized protein YkwD